MLRKAPELDRISGAFAKAIASLMQRADFTYDDEHELKQ